MDRVHGVGYGIFLLLGQLQFGKHHSLNALLVFNQP